MEIDSSGKTVEDAINAGLRKLGKTRDDVDVDILSEGSRGILGIGAEDARVRLRVKAPPAPPAERPAPLREQAPGARPAAPVREPSPAAQPAQRPARAPRQVVAEHPAIPEIADVPAETAARARDVVEELLTDMGLEAQLTVRGAEPRGVRTPDDGTPTCTVDIEGADLSILIGRRGETLSALQFLTNLIVSAHSESRVRVVVDVEHYWVRRFESLQGLAQRMAERVRDGHMPVTLEPMPPHERRIIHLTLADSPDVTTHSIGEGEERRVVISPRK